LIKTIRSLIGPSKKYQYITFVSSSASNVIWIRNIYFVFSKIDHIDFPFWLFSEFWRHLNFSSWTIEMNEFKEFIHWATLIIAAECLSPVNCL
jgi:hypothetical protein